MKDCFLGIAHSTRVGPAKSRGCCNSLVSMPFSFLPVMLVLLLSGPVANDDSRPRARDAGIAPGILSPGPLNGITDVPGVHVGHVTLDDGAATRTGVTVVLPHTGNVFQDRVPAAISVGNGFGKLMGITQVRELGEIETPIVLTNTLSVPEAAAGLVDWTLRQPDNEQVRSVNAVVGETNDGFLNDIRARAVRPEHVAEAIEAATSGPVPEGSVGAGTGTIAFGWKGGIGTSSRLLPAQVGGYTVGVLVQTNYGGVLDILGVPVGRQLGRYFMREVVDRGDADGSIMIVIATDAPLSDRNLERLAARAFLAVGRTGSPMTNGSGDYAIAFSTAESVRRTPDRRRDQAGVVELPNDRMSPLFQAVVEATEEAIYNSMFRAETMAGHRGTIEALPLDRVLEMMK
jgi:D-aminopeptidase